MNNVQRLLRENTRIRIELLDRTPGLLYPSRIEAVEPLSHQMLLAAPMDAIAVIPVEVGERLVLVIDDGTKAYRGESRILRRLARPLPAVAVEAPAAWSTSERRKLFRVVTTLPVHWGMAELGEAPYLASTRDLSGGGMRLRIDSPSPSATAALRLERGQRLRVEIELSAQTVRGTAELVRKEKGLRRIELSVQWVGLSHRHREDLVRYCFTVERVAMRKGVSD